MFGHKGPIQIQLGLSEDTPKPRIQVSGVHRLERPDYSPNLNPAAKRFGSLSYSERKGPDHIKVTLVPGARELLEAAIIAGDVNRIVSEPYVIEMSVNGKRRSFYPDMEFTMEDNSRLLVSLVTEDERDTMRKIARHIVKSPEFTATGAHFLAVSEQLVEEPFVRNAREAMYHYRSQEMDERLYTPLAEAIKSSPDCLIPLDEALAIMADESIAPQEGHILAERGKMRARAMACLIAFQTRGLIDFDWLIEFENGTVVGFPDRLRHTRCLQPLLKKHRVN